MANNGREQGIEITLESTVHGGLLGIPEDAEAIVVFAHGSGSSRFSQRNALVARTLRASGLATLMFDLLTEDEDRVYENRFDIDLLALYIGESMRSCSPHQFQLICTNL